MKKLFLLVSLGIIFASINSVCADEWDDFSAMERAWDGQKTITNKDFEQVIDALEEKTNKKEEKKKKKRFKKISGGGTSLHNELNPDNEIKTNEIVKPNTDGVLVNIPVTVFLDGQPLEKGYYKVLGERDKESKKIYISFYQSQFFKGKIEAYETNDDYDEQEVDFARLLPYNESFMKMIFGSLDFNAFAYIPYVE